MRLGRLFILPVLAVNTNEVLIRARMAVAELIEVLAQSTGNAVWASVHHNLLAIIHENFVREENPALLNLEDRQLHTIKKTPLMVHLQRFSRYATFG